MPPARPPPPSIEDDSLNVASTITFADLTLAAFDNLTFASQFRADFALAMARAAGVETWRVEVTGVAAGSVVVSSVVRFPPTAAALRDALETTLVTTPARLFDSSPTLSAYGAISATLPPSPPPSPVVASEVSEPTVEEKCEDECLVTDIEEARWTDDEAKCVRKCIKKNAAATRTGTLGLVLGALAAALHVLPLLG